MTTWKSMTSSGTPARTIFPWVDATGGIWLKVLRVDHSGGHLGGAQPIRAGSAPPDPPPYRSGRRLHHRPGAGTTSSTTSTAPRVPTSGSPPGSVHTLDVPADNEGVTEVLFVIEGVNLDLAPDGSVESVTDGIGTLAAYEALAEAQGFELPPASSAD